MTLDLEVNVLSDAARSDGVSRKALTETPDADPQVRRCAMAAGELFSPAPFPDQSARLTHAPPGASFSKPAYFAQ